MGDALLRESTLGVVVGVNSRLPWAEEWEVRKKLSLPVLSSLRERREGWGRGSSKKALTRQLSNQAIHLGSQWWPARVTETMTNLPPFSASK